MPAETLRFPIEGLVIQVSDAEGAVGFACGGAAETRARVTPEDLDPQAARSEEPMLNRPEIGLPLCGDGGSRHRARQLGAPRLVAGLRGRGRGHESSRRA